MKIEFRPPLKKTCISMGVVVNDELPLKKHAEGVYTLMVCHHCGNTGCGNTGLHVKTLDVETLETIICFKT